MESKKKPIFTEGEYAVVNMELYGSIKRGMIGMVDTILEAEDDDQYVEFIIPYRDDEGRALRKVQRIWCKFLEHLPDEAMNCMDIQEINRNLMTKRNVYGEWMHRNKIIRETPTERLIDELKIRDEFNELEPEKIIFNNPATIVFWNDGSKTVVKCTAGQKFSEYYGYLAAMAKKMYGTNGTITRLIEKHRVYGDRHVEPESIINTAREEKHLSKKETIRRSMESMVLRKASLIEGMPFDIEFNKRYKANNFWREIEDAIQSKGKFTIPDLLKKENRYGLDAGFFTNYGWDTLYGITVTKLAPDRWKVSFPGVRRLRE